MTDDYVMVPREALEKLRSVLCGPEGHCCIDGSDEDRRIVDEALALLSAAPPPPAREATSEIQENNATRLLRQSYVTLAFAFRRLHESSRARDGELCSDFQKVRADIEAHFRSIGVRP